MHAWLRWKIRREIGDPELRNTGSLTNTIIFLLEKQARYARLALEHSGRTGAWLDVLPNRFPHKVIGR
ncbi:hypothetical protein ACQPZ2_26570 [Nocardia pseudovaccinii]|uniref:hypothetical protein n=1 Tax=Nocardia pseudovaccinii TaxID=189540 RepID=UPI003D936EE3